MPKFRFPILLCTAALLLASCSTRGAETHVPGAAGSGELSLLEASNSAVGEMVSLTAASSASLDLSFPQTFAITRPTEELKTSYASYFITGTSNPGQPVYFDGEEIQRQGTKGLFGVHVQLEMGTNTFKFSQGDKSETVTIVRTAQTVPVISDIVQSSMYPSYTGSGRVGGNILVQCNAPSGATVTATWGGNTTTLTQAASATPGVEAVFRGSLPVSGSYAAGETTKAGKVTYTLTYNGATKTYESNGEIYIAGEGANLAVRVNQYLGTVYDDPTVQSVYRELYKEGTADYIIDQTANYYQLSSGGYIPTSQADIIAGKPNLKNTFSGVSSSFQSKAEVFTFQGTEKPAFYTKIGDGTFSVTFYNTSGTPSVDISSSRVFSGVSVTDNGGSVTYTFTQKGTGNLWGYNVNYDGSDTVLRIAYKPRLAEGSQPLSGIKICLDPGHGDKDNGAKGVPGDSGPTEAVLNLAHALAVKEQLEAKGATVVMTRDTVDGFLELNERLEFFENSGADMFISLHHNSLGENSDANKPSGIEIYYHTVSSKNSANYMYNALVAGTGRVARFVNKDYYRVTILPYAPSMLCELGYLCNPLEYERVTSQVDTTAAAVVQGVINALS